MGCYTHLDLDERRKLYQLTSAGRSPRQAAAELGRHASTIYRELKRNHRFDEEPMFRGYFPLTAQSMAAGRRLRGAKISRYPGLASYIVDRLEVPWSPEQIAGYLRHRTAGLLRVSHETIYQFVYGPDGQAAKLARLLPTGRWKRRRRYERKPRGLNIPPAHTIAARPQDIAERADFGHWEGDVWSRRLVVRV